MVFYSCKAVHLCLYQTGEAFAFRVIWVIEYLGSAGRRIREAVLMYTYCTVYFTFFDKGFSFFQITGFFIGGTAIFEASVFTPGQDNLNTILFQDRFTF